MESLTLEKQMESGRKLTKNEEQIIAFLISNSSLDISANWSKGLLVRSLDDGGMGSLYLFYKEASSNIKRKFGKQVSEMTFIDDDGIEVIVSLNVDEQEMLYELDVWKTDYSRVISKFPTMSHVEQNDINQAL